MLITGLSIALLLLGVLHLCATDTVLKIDKRLTQKLSFFPEPESNKSITILNLTGRKLSVDADYDLWMRRWGLRILGILMILSGLARLVWGS